VCEIPAKAILIFHLFIGLTVWFGAMVKSGEKRKLAMLLK
jgi:hypothetical protein